jgi:Flp pilus assembly protein TadG
MQPRKKRQTERGSTLVESVLILLTFLLVLIGTVDFGQVIYFHQALVERARVAARYGAIHPTDTTGIQNMAVYNTSDGSTPKVLPDLTTGMVNVQNPDVNTSAARVVVTISAYPIHFMSPYIAQTFNSLPIQTTISSETQMP